jgi:ribosomal protein S18 acetylase RimI-like enzyme
MTAPGDVVRQSIEPRVRALAARDAATLAAFAERLFRETYSDQYAASDIEAYVAQSFGAERQAAELAEPGASVLVVEDDHSGLLAFAHMRESAAPDVVVANRPIEIARFYVDRPWHGRGIARVLMAACVAEARSRVADAIWLLVYQHNGRAIAFYEKHGFRPVGTRPFALGSQVDQDWVMVRLVASS